MTKPTKLTDPIRRAIMDLAVTRLDDHSLVAAELAAVEAVRIKLPQILAIPAKDLKVLERHCTIASSTSLEIQTGNYYGDNNSPSNIAEYENERRHPLFVPLSITGYAVNKSRTKWYTPTIFEMQPHNINKLIQPDNHVLRFKQPVRFLAHARSHRNDVLTLARYTKEGTQHGWLNNHGFGIAEKLPAEANALLNDMIAAGMTRLRAKVALIRAIADISKNSKTLEDVEAVWPDAAEVRSGIIKNLPALLPTTKASIELIKNHLAAAKPATKTATKATKKVA
jgi:hypothetical protein